MNRLVVLLGGVLAVAPGCNGPAGDAEDGPDESTGDGDPSSTGDGDGDPSSTGDGDGDPSSTGDGDPSSTGDGDEDTLGGDGDDCVDPGEPGPIAFETVEIAVYEFFRDQILHQIVHFNTTYHNWFGHAAPVLLGDQWVLVVNEGGRPMGTSYQIVDVENLGNCSLDATLHTTRLADNCDNFSFTRVGPAAAVVDAVYEPAGGGLLVTTQTTEFDCALDGLGEFEDCDESQWCAPGLICAGITRADAGLCMDASLRGEFDSGPIDASVPANDVTMATLDVNGLATVDTDVVVSVHLEHADPSALTITLTNPDSNQVMVWDQEPSPYDSFFYTDEPELLLSRAPQGFSGDESVNGTWTLTITNTSDEAGVLLDWGLEIMSRFD